MNTNTNNPCPPFPTIADNETYLSTISPPRDLICPISQELFRDPVVCAGDGCTYDRSGISTWIRSQQQQQNGGGSGGNDDDEILIQNRNGNNEGAVRSPVTNAFMDTTPMRMTTTATTTNERSTTIASNNHDDDNEIATETAGTGTERSTTTTTTTMIPPDLLIENRAIARMASAQREKLGLEICRICNLLRGTTVTNNNNNNDEQTNIPKLLVSVVMAPADNGFRLKSLVEAGADLSLRGCWDGTTALTSIVRGASFLFGRDGDYNYRDAFLMISLALYFVKHGAPVLSTDNDGIDLPTFIASIEPPSLPTTYHHPPPTSSSLTSALSSSSSSSTLLINNAKNTMKSWSELTSRVEYCARVETAERTAREKARMRCNVRRRERQEELSTLNRRRIANGGTINNNNNNGNGNGNGDGGDNNGNDNSSQGGLGRLTDGRGYFPSLVTLQYQGSIPDPSPSIFVTEGPERERLKRILNLFFFTLVVYAIMC